MQIENSPQTAEATMKQPPSLPIRVLTHNIRYMTSRRVQGEATWLERLPLLAAELLHETRYNAEAFICLQEVLHQQLLDILSALNSHSPASTWTHIGVGRDDGQKDGEYSPIIYRSDIWTLWDSKTTWLSPTPKVPSKGWDAGCRRILTTAVFQHGASGQRLVAMNTHLDNFGPVSRLESAKLILAEIKDLLSSDENPVFLTGDFNSEASQEAYLLLNDKASVFQDMRELVPKEARYGHENTWTGFSKADWPENRIDFIFLGPREKRQTPPSKQKVVGWEAQAYAVLESRFDDGVYSSDHRAVVGDLLLTG
ncbi:MAG: hypothetical protein M1829_001895 [Trizodia sp. TS-e1964]|nr:MAG: hypothetical protein M1829_001895 [Trizodia sp. TS-e1964]